MATIPTPRIPVRFQALYDDTQEPTRGTELAAGYDLRAYLRGRKVTYYRPDNSEATTTAHDGTITLMPGERAKVPLGFKAQVSEGWAALVLPRSGQALKVGLVPANPPGLVDADFPGEWHALMTNVSSVPLVITHEERIAQCILVPHAVAAFEHTTIGQVSSRAGGYGSTGT